MFSGEVGALGDARSQGRCGLHPRGSLAQLFIIAAAYEAHYMLRIAPGAGGLVSSSSLCALKGNTNHLAYGKGHNLAALAAQQSTLKGVRR